MRGETTSVCLTQVRPSVLLQSTSCTSPAAIRAFIPSPRLRRFPPCELATPINAREDKPDQLILLQSNTRPPSAHAAGGFFFGHKNAFVSQGALIGFRNACQHSNSPRAHWRGHSCFALPPFAFSFGTGRAAAAPEAREPAAHRIL